MTLFEFLNLSRIVTSVTKSPLQWWFTLLVIVIVNAEKVIKPVDDIFLSSLRAESARAFTGRRNSHSGRGEVFLSRQPSFFTETAVTPERKVEKWFPRWEINRHAEG